jgi:hypothetical protein
MPLSLIEAASVLLYLAPVVAVVVVRARKDRALWEFALDVPFAVSIDILSIMALSRFVRLEYAALVSRAVWLLGLLACYVKKRRFQIAWPERVRPGHVVSALGAAVIVNIPFIGVSRRLLLWDRHWHGPLVTSMGAQTAPFFNVFDPHSQLHYHLSGDVQAAAIRALSLNTLSSLRALATAHDLTLGLMAISLCLLLFGLGHRRPFWAVAAGLIVLLQTPIPKSLDYEGVQWAYHPFISLTYRPHVPLAALMMVGFVGAVAVPMIHAVRPQMQTYPTLAATVALLAMSDEVSVAILGLALGLVWLVEPATLGNSRKEGVLALAGLAVALLAPGMLFGGSLAPGGPVQNVHWVSEGRLASVHPNGGALAIATREGMLALLRQTGPFFAASIAVWLLALAAKSKSLGILALFSTLVAALSSFLALHLEVNGAPDESQRFFIAPYVVSFVLGLGVLPRMRQATLAPALLVGATVLPAFVAMYWFSEDVRRAAGFEGTRSLAVNCRQSLGAQVGEPLAAAYVESSQYFHVLACRPAITPGVNAPPWPIKIYPLFKTAPQLRFLTEELVPDDATLPVLCGREAPHDPVCEHAMQSTCRPEGDDLMRCALAPADRRTLLAKDSHP